MLDVENKWRAHNWALEIVFFKGDGTGQNSLAPRRLYELLHASATHEQSGPAFSINAL